MGIVWRQLGEANGSASLNRTHFFYAEGEKYVGVFGIAIIAVIFIPIIWDWVFDDGGWIVFAVVAGIAVLIFFWPWCLIIVIPCLAIGSIIFFNRRKKSAVIEEIDETKTRYKCPNCFGNITIHTWANKLNEIISEEYCCDYCNTQYKKSDFVKEEKDGEDIDE